MLPLIKLLTEYREPVKLSEIAKTLEDRSGLSQEELELRLSSGTKTVFYDRVGWAKTYLVKAGLISQPKRGLCELTDLGRSLDLQNLKQITNEYLMQFESFYSYKVGHKEENTDFISQSKEIRVNKQDQEHRTPNEIIDSTLLFLNSAIKDELLSSIKRNSPNFFEQLVVDLLVAMGYGGTHKDTAEAFKKSHDGGIDGVISEDRLGLDKIYIQAKRWDSTAVGRPDIQQFKGALADQDAKKGIFITTSTFTKGAKESAAKSGIVLIDGDKLTSLMIEFGLGVQVERSFHIYKIDQDRFDEESL